MRTRLVCVLVASVVGLALVAGNPAETFAQKIQIGGGSGGWGGQPGGWGGYPGGYSGYGGNYGGYGYGPGLSVGGNNWGMTLGNNYGGWGSPYYSTYGSSGWGSPYYSGYGYGGWNSPYYSNYYSPGYSYSPSYSSYPYYGSSMPYYPTTGYGYGNGGSYQSSYYSPGQSQQPSQQPTGPTKSATIEDGKFVPDKLEITQGTTVTWTNKGQKVHNLAQPFRNWKSQDLSPGQSYTWTFTQTGTYDLICSHHPKMKLTVVVK